METKLLLENALFFAATNKNKFSAGQLEQQSTCMYLPKCIAAVNEIRLKTKLTPRNEGMKFVI